MRHNKCGHEYEVLPRMFLGGNRCPKCAGHIKKTHEEFVREVFDLVGDEYEVLGKYINAKTSVQMQHNKCGYVFEMRAGTFISGARCPKCGGKLQLTNDEFLGRLKNMYGDEYTPLEEYKTTNTKIKMRHNICGHEYLVQPAHIMRGVRCPNCCKTVKRTHKEFVEMVSDLTGEEYIVLGEYKNIKTKILMKHEKCGHEYFVQPNSFISGRRCPKCYGNQKLTNKEFTGRIYDLVRDEYTFLEEYIGYMDKIKVCHNECGHVYRVTPSSFFQGTRCPKCSFSKGEKRVTEFLEDNEFKYESEKVFKDLKDGGYLRFDFYLPKHKIAIEYDGRQHYEPVNYNGKSDEKAEKYFKITQKHDKMKNDYCLKNNIKLIRIPYWEYDNISDILRAEIS